jgi:hypothetical protein
MIPPLFLIALVVCAIIPPLWPVAFFIIGALAFMWVVGLLFQIAVGVALYRARK